MATNKLSQLKCAACENRLAYGNTNPHSLCGKCQRVLVPGQPRFQAWLAQGRPPVATLMEAFPVRHVTRPSGAERIAARISRQATVEVASNHASEAGLPPVDRLPLEYLAKCVAEFRFRAEQAAKISALSKRLGVK